jgi:hypothetical protein
MFIDLIINLLLLLLLEFLYEVSVQNRCLKFVNINVIGEILNFQ